ncbi:DNA-binding GntR family transcriptional regulator [Sphingomonas leidyi]|uniref:DNA-binding GntR family transcriptional regulator n=1 Tax=Sphingomonas leidyi TaxID=68569 RepID=A0A7X5UVT9_9SPHN|nr:DNA-binding GntR family transcriptional regulator [Sphingomonas leidyi]
MRDALHRLTGERLVEAPNHNGFRVPLPTEAGLRDLYSWRARLLALATRNLRAGPAATRERLSVDQMDPGEAMDRLFLEIAGASGSAEHVAAIAQLNGRLAPLRRAEFRIFDNLVEEHEGIRDRLLDGDGRSLTSLLERYHRRRLRAVSDILAAVYSDRR